jgi:hypothetical protein
MNNRNVMFICFFILLICAGLSASVFFGQKKLAELKIEYESLTKTHNKLDVTTTNMNAKKQVFENTFEVLKERLKVGVGENVDFYDEAQQAIRRGGARVLSSTPNPPKDGRISMKMSFIGDYYTLIKAFAQLRELPNVVRVVNVSLSSPIQDTSVNSEIKADVLLEALAYSSK